MAEIRARVNIVIVREGAVLLGRPQHSVEWRLPSKAIDPAKDMEEEAIECAQERVKLTLQKSDIRLVANVHEWIPSKGVAFYHHVYQWLGRMHFPPSGDKLYASWDFFQFDKLPPTLLAAHREAIVLYRSGKTYSFMIS